MGGVAVLIASISAMLIATASAFAKERVALVVGNAAYEHTARLANPLNDATDVAGALERLGFEVLLGLDLDLGGMRDHARRFAEMLDGAEIGLFYYAGHGLQVDGVNYLAPVDTSLDSPTDLDFGTIRLELVLRQMEREVPTSIVFLDACRDNPMTANLARSMGTRSGSIGRGLARVEAGVGTLLAFATQPGNVALDGKGRNSPFTAALLGNLERPGVDLADLMISVRRDVLGATGGKQVPWEHSSLTGRVYLAGTAHGPGPAGAPAADSAMVEVAFWQSVDGSDDPRRLEAYLRHYPDGIFAELARLKIEELTVADRAAAAPGPDDSEPVVDRAEIRRAQELLYEQDYDPGPVDGVIGGQTRRALRDFQKDHGLTPDGVLRPGVIERLQALGSLTPWGQIVYSPARQDWGMAWGHETRADAAADAQSSCGKGGRCEEAVSFHGHECGAFAHSEGGWAMVVADSTREAEAKALGQCSKRGEGCRIIAVVCADGTSRHVAGQ